MTITSRAKKTLVIGIVLNILAILLYGGLLIIIDKKSEMTITYLTDLTLEEEKAERLAAAKKVVVAAENDATKLASYGVHGVEEQVAFISFIEQVGRTASVSVEVKNPTVEKQSSPKDKDYFSLKLLALGKWQNIMHFVSLIETLPMNISISSLSFVSEMKPASADDTGQQRSVWQAELELKVLNFK